MAISFNRVAGNNGSNNINIGAVIPAGHLIFAAIIDLGIGGPFPNPTDTAGNTYIPVFNGLFPGNGNGQSAWVGYAVPVGSTNPIVTWSYTPGANSACIIADYSGLSKLSKSVRLQNLAANVATINCGPVSTLLGALTLITTFQQGNTYTSTTGAVNRLFTNQARLNLVDNLGATGNYTEQGSVTGGSPIQFGGSAFSVGMTTSPSSNQLMTVGAGA